MLLIGDLHITSRIKDKVLAELQTFVDQYPDEQTIIFLGDYVYHFSYDRNALMGLYHFFLELLMQGKNLYILAGNHDWLGNSFVFEEAKKAFEIIQDPKLGIFKSSLGGKIHFITQALLEEIEGEKIFFLPYFLYNEPYAISNIHENDMELSSLAGEIKMLLNSQNKNEKLSGIINHILLDIVQKEKNLTIIHHHYFNKTSFPGQKSFFTYKDVALHEGFLDMKNLKFISGHLHKAFTYKNYLCTGSVRCPTSLENNQIKYLFAYQNNNLKVYETHINPYITLEYQEILDEKKLVEHLEKIRENAFTSVSNSKERNITDLKKRAFELHSLSLTLQVDTVDYEHIEKFIDQNLQKKIKDIKLKKNIQNIENVIENFEISGKNLSQSFSDWKEFLKKYLKIKYPNDFQKYEKILHEMKIL